MKGRRGVVYVGIGDVRECAFGVCGEVDILDADVEEIFDVGVPAVGDKEAGTWGDCDGRRGCLLASRAREGDAGNAAEETGESIGCSVMVECGDPAPSIRGGC